MGTTADVVAVGLRAMSFVAALQAAGVALFLSAFSDGLRSSVQPVTSLAVRSAVFGLILTIVAQVVEPARLAGALRGVFDLSLQGLLLETDAGTTTVIRSLGLALVAAGCVASARFGGTTALAGAMLVVVSFAFMGHTASTEHRWLSASVLIVHLGIVAFWFGALWPLHLASRHESSDDTGRLVTRFSAAAVRIVPIILLAGLVLAAVLLPGWASLRSGYGLLLLAKVAGFTLLMVLAAFNKWRLGPRILCGDVSAIASLRGSICVEWWLIAAIVVTTAVMTALFSPSH